MSLLPTAHSGQSYGSRRIDFFTVSGHVASSESASGHVTDTDGMDHEVKLLDQTSALAPGDTATVLRVQSGPNRRSRPVAIVNHSRGVWMRAAPDATSTLSKSGVTRTFNWWLSMLILIVVGAASVWPDIHGFLTELSGPMMASVPVFDIFADLAVRMPNLASWRLETELPAGIFNALASLGFVPMENLTPWGLGLAGGIVALIAFAARSWRLIYIPAFAALALIGGAVMGGADATLYMTGGALGLFMIGGFINRMRDGGRFNARVDRLAEHVMRNPPQESVGSRDTPANHEIANDPDNQRDELAPAAAAAVAIATAAAIAEGDDTETEETDEIEDDLPDADDLAAAVALNEAEAAGEIPGESSNEDLGDDLGEQEAQGQIEDERTMPVASPPPMPTADEPNADKESSGEESSDTSEADVSEADAEADVTVVETAIEAETEEADIAASDDTPQTEDTLESIATETGDTETGNTETDALENRQDIMASDADSHNVDGPGVVHADDPLIDDAADPMTENVAAGDFAPGAPDIEFDR